MERYFNCGCIFKEKVVTNKERIEEIERELSALKAEVVKEEKVDYPCVMINKDRDDIWLIKEEQKGIKISGEYLVDNFGKESHCLRNDTGYWTPFTGTITYRNGKPV